MNPDTYVALAIIAGSLIYWIWRFFRLRRLKRAFIHAGRNSELAYLLACKAKALQHDFRSQEENQHVVDTVVEQTLEEETP